MRHRRFFFASRSANRLDRPAISVFFRDQPPDYARHLRETFRGIISVPRANADNTETGRETLFPLAPVIPEERQRERERERGVGELDRFCASGDLRREFRTVIPR